MLKCVIPRVGGPNIILLCDFAQIVRQVSPYRLNMRSIPRGPTDQMVELCMLERWKDSDGREKFWDCYCLAIVECRNNAPWQIKAWNFFFLPKLIKLSNLLLGYLAYVVWKMQGTQKWLVICSIEFHSRPAPLISKPSLDIFLTLIIVSKPTWMLGSLISPTLSCIY